MSRVYPHQAAALASVAGRVLLEYIVMLGNGGGIDFQASQCIPGFILAIQSNMPLDVGIA